VLLDAADGLAADLPAFAALLAYDALLAGASPPQVAEMLSAFAARSDARLIDAYAAHAAALAAGDGAALMDVADTFSAIGARRYAKEAAVHAGTCFTAAGRNDLARRAAARALALYLPDQGLEPPVVDGVGDKEAELTRREQQIVGLARQGMSNVQIAEQFVLSVRTVESHLYNAMRKLGIDDRSDL
jgi:DNA-binding NarL/FixJ family response regulator